mgnify:CR=1 FL=1
MNKKNTIRFTESELKQIITESVKRVLKEGYSRTENVKENLIVSFEELEEALTSISDRYSFTNYLQHLSDSIQSACRLIDDMENVSNLKQQRTV